MEPTSHFEKGAVNGTKMNEIGGKERREEMRF